MFVGGGGGINAIALDMPTPTYQILASLLGLETFKKFVVGWVGWVVCKPIFVLRFGLSQSEQ